MVVVLVALVAELSPAPAAASVTYDHRSIIINGQRRILISGSIHYPRSTPEVNAASGSLLFSFSKIFFCLCWFIIKYLVFVHLGCVQMWPDLIQKAKDGGLDVIQTYVFWNGHEPSQGQVCNFFVQIWNFYDVGFLAISLFWFGFFLFLVVLFWGEVWSGSLHQACEAGWALCSSPHWPLYLCWMEFWVKSYF